MKGKGSPTTIFGKASKLANQFISSKGKQPKKSSKFDYTALQDTAEDPCDVALKKSAQGHAKAPREVDLVEGVERLVLEHDHSRTAAVQPSYPTAHLNSSTLDDNVDGREWSIPNKRNQARTLRTSKDKRIEAPCLTPWENDWRKKDPEAQRARISQACTRRTTQTRGTYNFGLRTRDGVAHADLVPGTIIWRFDTRQGNMKGRYWLIVKSTSRKIWVIAIYTNNDTGLKLVPARFHKAYFSVAPLGADLASFPNQYPGHEVVPIVSIDPHRNRSAEGPLRQTMVARFTEVIQHDIDEAGVRLVGTVNPGKVAYVVELTRKHVE
ncbi:hypothetical protein LTR17_022950 [Elasticomyces elasticus]|nr:hypothetical protein LTR17_022950 [Elasticomyces elasticus]